MGGTGQGKELRCKTDASLKCRINGTGVSFARTKTRRITHIEHFSLLEAPNCLFKPERKTLQFHHCDAFCVVHSNILRAILLIITQD